MFEIVIASHGPLAGAMQESLTFFFSEVENIHVAAIDRDGLEKFQKQMDTIFQSIGDREVLVFTDLLFGTPFNEAGKRVGKLKQNFELLAGVNMPILVEAVNLQKQEKKLADIIDSLKQSGSIQSYKDRLSEMYHSNDDE
uniref:PTS sugar transporter subunit IIA n=1 Tax=Candidatus Enterococcus willemsii TaxID=1857215 RepID=UPI00403F2639